MDKKEFLINYLKKVQRIFCRSAYNFKRVNNINSNSNREWITIIETIYADGISLSFSLIY